MVWGLVACIFLALVTISPAFAQTSDGQTSNQVTLSGDLENNPVAQDILDEIEKSKRWIEQLQQKNFEAQERQRELEEKRAEVLKILEDDLKEWEDLWEYYTFDSMLERALENSTARFTDSIYDHPLKFTASKIHAGRDALQQVVLEGGGPREARAAFVEAAKITREEMIVANIFYNVLSGNAYYGQQVLFDSDGQFHDIVSGEQLRKYYQDYKTSPAYLTANPFDKIARDSTSQKKGTECRIGYVLIHRIDVGDYVCVTEQTSEMWIRHGMGELDSETFDAVDYMSFEKLKQDRVNEKIKNINHQLDTMYDSYEKKIDSITANYANLLIELESEQRDEEKKMLESSSISPEYLSRSIQNVRDMYDTLKENLSQDKTRSLEILQANHKQDMDNFVSNFESIAEVEIVWNADESKYEAIKS